MSVAVSIYVHDQAEVQYPLRFIVSSLPPDWIVRIFYSDEATELAAKRDLHGISGMIYRADHKYPLPEGPSFYRVDVPIKTPTDVGRAQTECVRFLRETLGVEQHILVLQADAWLTPHGINVVRSLVQNGWDRMEEYPYGIWSMPVKLYCETYANYCAATLVGPESPYDLLEGQTYSHKIMHDNSLDGIMAFDDDAIRRPVIDISYLDTQMYIRKIRHHQTIWPDENKPMVLQSMMQGSSEGIAAALRSLEEECGRAPTLVDPIARPQYFDLISRLGLWDDYWRVARTL